MEHTTVKTCVHSELWCRARTRAMTDLHHHRTSCANQSILAVRVKMISMTYLKTKHHSLTHSKMINKDGDVPQNLLKTKHRSPTHSHTHLGLEQLHLHEKALVVELLELLHKLIHQLQRLCRGGKGPPRRTNVRKSLSIVRLSCTANTAPKPKPLPLLRPVRMRQH